MKAKFSKRILAYLVDALIITIVSYVVTFAIPISNKAQEAAKKITEYKNQYIELVGNESKEEDKSEVEEKEDKKEEETKDSKEKTKKEEKDSKETKKEEKVVDEEEQTEELTKDEIIELMNENTYIYNRETMLFSVIDIIITIGYFVVLQYKMNGQTVGKKLLKIKLEPKKEGKEITINRLLLRYAILSSYASNILFLLGIIFLKKPIYFKFEYVVTIARVSLFLIAIISTAFSKDNIGIHDYVSGTKCVEEEK